MTCFWDGIMQSLSSGDKQLLGLDNNNSIYNLIDCLKLKNNNTANVIWQNDKFRNQQVLENKEHIRLYNSAAAKSGYLCSTCDPFLILLCELLERNIAHNYLGNTITYRNTKNSQGTFFFKSDRGHFWFSNKN